MERLASVLRPRWSLFQLARLKVLLCRAYATTSAAKLPQNVARTDYEDLCCFTGGRWLWAEEARLQERYKKFNVPGLQRLAADAVGARWCASISKLAAGGFIKIFRVCMDNGSVVIARIPNPNVGSVSEVMASEVATMDFARNILGLPVPRVLAWDGRSTNSANCEYILMEEAKGIQLGEIWQDLDLDDKFKIIDDVVAFQQKLQSVSFSRYGNLYLRADAPTDYCDIDVHGDLPSSLKSCAKDRFVIGPVSEQAFVQSTDRGPWPDAQSYLRAISRRERAVMPPIDDAASTQPPYTDLNSPQAWLSLLDKFDAVSPYLPPQDPDLNRATLFHWDLRAPNIFAEDRRITSLIDWQDAWVGPLVTQERRPQLVEYHGEMILRLPDYYETMEDNDEKAKLTDRVEKSILLWYYGQEVQEKNPTLQKLFDLPLARKRREAVLFASELWEGETIPVRECLHQLQRDWDKLATGIPCPIGFPQDEIEAHDRAAADWNEKADFWSSLTGFVSREGFVANEDYDEARKMFEGLREAGLACLSGAELAEFEKGSRWAQRLG